MSASPRPESPIGFYDPSDGRHSPVLDAYWPHSSSSPDTGELFVQLDSPVPVQDSPGDKDTRKRLAKACDRCRFKKSKCDGSSPCHRCRADNTICVHGERKRSHDKVYPKGYVGILEQERCQLVAALRKMYARLRNKQGWPGEPLGVAQDGYTLTHEILGRLDDLPDESKMLSTSDNNKGFISRDSTSFDCSTSWWQEPKPDGSVTKSEGPEPTDPAPWEDSGPWDFARHTCRERKETVMVDSKAEQPTPVSSLPEEARNSRIFDIDTEETPALPAPIRSTRLLEPARSTKISKAEDARSSEVYPVTKFAIGNINPSPPLRPRGGIRVLSCESPTDLRYKMVRLNFDDLSAPPYAALSYAWGESDSQDRIAQNTICVDGETRKIRSNLHDFLAQWSSTLCHKKIMLWVDSVSINQDDVEEREAQVAQMGEIFTKAKAVWAWLGPSNHANGTINIFEKLHEWTSRFPSPPRDAAYGPDAWTNFGAPEAMSSHFWSGFTQLIIRPWWTRAWIVQEITCNPSAFLLCGSTCMNYQIWRHALLALNKTIILKSKIRPLFWDEFREHFNAAVTLLNLKQRISQFRSSDRSPAVMFLETLEMTSHTNCSDPRDKVYAILGLTPDLVRSTILPDYHISDNGLWLHVVHFLSSYMPDGHKLEFLRDLPNDRPRQNLPATIRLADSSSDIPSWLVNWAEVISEQSQYCSQYRGGRRFYNPDYWNYSNPLIEGGRLVVRGACIGTVREALPSWMQGNQVYPSKLVGICNDIASSSEKYSTGETLRDVVDRTIIMDLDFTNWPHVTRNGRAKWPQYLSNGANVEPVAYERWRHHGHSLSMAAKNRRLFWTSQGHLGLGPLRLHAGDKLCVFFGSQMLHLLGEIGPGRYEYVGEAYVHGLMDGEAIWKVNDQGGGELFAIE